MRAPLSWLREYVSVDATAHEIARRLAVSSLEVERVIDVGVADVGDNLAHLRRRQGRRGREAPERRQAPALPGRRRGGRAAADRLRRLELRRRRDRRGRAARRAAARLPGAARRAAAARRAVARDDPRRGRDRPRHRPRRDHAAPRRDRAGNAARRRPAARRPGARRDADDEPRRPALDGRARPRGGGAVRRRAAARRPSTTRRSSIREWVDVTVDDLEGCPRYIGRVLRERHGRPVAACGCARGSTLAGMRSISNVVDVTNYVMHVYGQPAARVRPLEARAAAGSSCAARTPGEELRTLDGTLRELDERDLLITDGEKAGRARGDHGRPRQRGRRTTTTEVLLEAANFEPIGILHTSERLGLRTEGSNRWEKGVDPYLAEPAAVLASRLLVDLAGAELTGARRRARRPAGAARRPAPARAHGAASSASTSRRTSSARSSSGSGSRSPTTGT